MPHEDKNYDGSLVLDFRKRWRHVKTIYSFAYARAVNISWYCRLTFAARDWF